MKLCLPLHRLIVLLALALLTTSPSILAKDSGDSAIVEPVEHPPPSSGTNSDERIDNLQLERLKRAHSQSKKIDIFPSKSWYVAPPPPPPTPTPAPTAPNLPFSFLGKQLDEQGKLTIFLAEGDRVRLVSTGETLDNTYSVDAIENGKLVFTYLPLQIKQYLSIGDTP
ncbi:MAG: hypothetical protein HY080_14905 [Gammaproteobacteria bacterium]|nr:hypothetical protein [Gammaproteobacteria bacterium]